MDNGNNNRWRELLIILIFTNVIGGILTFLKIIQGGGVRYMVY